MRLPIAGLSTHVEIVYTDAFVSILAPNPGTGIPQALLNVCLSTTDAVLSLLDRHSSNRYVIVTPQAIFGTTDRNRASALAELLDLPSDLVPVNTVMSRHERLSQDELDDAKVILFKLIDPESN